MISTTQLAALLSNRRQWGPRVDPRARSLGQARAAGAGGGEGGHLLGRVVLDVLQAQQAVGDHGVAAHAHVQVAVWRVFGVAEPDRVVGEVPVRRKETRGVRLYWRKKT